MKPVAIFRHLPHEGAGYLADYLAEQAIPTEMICIDAGDAVPQQASHFAGLVFMGGSMSVNDPLPWIPDSLALIRQAVKQRIPVLGHCLGGQLLAKAMGGQVTLNPVKEIGWGMMERCDTDASGDPWLGCIRRFNGFHWHGETFSLPAGAQLLLKSQWCNHQAFVLDNIHLGLQCHVEMTADMIRSWCQEGVEELAQAQSSPGVQTAAEMQAGMTQHLSELHRIADTLYSRWIKGLQTA